MKYVNPSGFGLAFLCFLLPFFTVSCSGGDVSYEVTYSGFDLAFAGEPSVQAPAGEAFSEQELDEIRSETPVLAVFTVFAVLGGAVASAVMGFLGRSALWNRVTALGCALLSLLLLITNQVALHSGVARSLETEGGVLYGAVPEMVGTRDEIGFWLVLLLLLGIAAFNTAELLIHRRSPASGAAPLPGAAPPRLGEPLPPPRRRPSTPQPRSPHPAPPPPPPPQPRPAPPPEQRP